MKFNLYQWTLILTVRDKETGKVIREFNWKSIFKLTPNLCFNCLPKYKALPVRKFLNSKSDTPEWTCVYQHSSLPLPLPIRVPVGFFVKGKWGKAFNQTNLLV